MAKFIYNNAKNASTSYMFFELNYDYQPYVSYKKDIDPYFKSKLADDLASELKKLIVLY